MNVVQLMQENGQGLMCFYQSYYSNECNSEVEKIGRLILGLKTQLFLVLFCSNGICFMPIKNIKILFSQWFWIQNIRVDENELKHIRNK